MEGDYNFIDSENWQGNKGEGITYELIVLQQIVKVRDEGSKEFTGGFYETKEGKNGKVMTQWRADQKEVYMNSVNTLYDLLLPYFDDDMNKDYGDIDEAIRKLKQEKIEKLKSYVSRVASPQLKKDLEIQIQTGYLDRESIEGRDFIEGKLNFYRKLFQKLILLFNRQNHLMSGSINE